MKESQKSRNGSTAWLAFGGLLALGLTIFIIQELPSIRRELRIMRM